MSNDTMSLDLMSKFAQKLACNEEKARNRGIKRLQKWLRHKCSQGGLTSADASKLWKGLHYTMWMCDMPLVQEELADRLAALLPLCGSLSQVTVFLTGFLQTEVREWPGIDRFRTDKFLTLHRRMFRSCLTMMKKEAWSTDAVGELLGVYDSALISNAAASDGLKGHVADFYLEEVEGCADAALQWAGLALLLRPYVRLAASTRRQAVFERVVRRVFMRLVDAELERRHGDPADTEQPAASVTLPVDFPSLADTIFEAASSSDTLARNRKDLYDLVKVVKSLGGRRISNGHVPTGKRTPPSPLLAKPRRKTRKEKSPEVPRQHAPVSDRKRRRDSSQETKPAATPAGETAAQRDGGTATPPARKKQRGAGKGKRYFSDGDPNTPASETHSPRTAVAADMLQRNYFSLQSDKATPSKLTNTPQRMVKTDGIKQGQHAFLRHALSKVDKTSPHPQNRVQKSPAGDTPVSGRRVSFGLHLNRSLDFSGRLPVSASPGAPDPARPASPGILKTATPDKHRTQSPLVK